jgi:hypothetical protein
MKASILILSVLCVILTAGICAAQIGSSDVYVSPYTTHDGQHVDGYHRSMPDGNLYDFNQRPSYPRY